MKHRTPRHFDEQFHADVVTGLSRPQKQLPPKYFYDETGSQLFDQITALDEYYLTRCDLAIMQTHAAAMAAHCGPQCMLIELGAGSLRKVRWLLQELDNPAAYVPVDLSGEHLQSAAEDLAADFPQLLVHPVVADFARPIDLPAIPARKRVVYFPGSTLGNFEPAEADALLKQIQRLVGPGGGLLLGVDLQKERATLEQAYNDHSGVTAAFNRNLLERMNRELGAGFDPAMFAHRAYFNERFGRVEMHLVSLADQQVRVNGQVFGFRSGETIHTENSYKYDLQELKKRAADCGWRADAVWSDAQQYFAVLYLTAQV